MVVFALASTHAIILAKGIAMEVVAAIAVAIVWAVACTLAPAHPRVLGARVIIDFKPSRDFFSTPS